MKNPIIILLVVIMFSCTPEDILDNVYELVKQKKYQVGLDSFCDDFIYDVTWYCISKTEYDRLLGLPISCDIISITSSSGIKYTGILNSDRFRHTDELCKN